MKDFNISDLSLNNIEDYLSIYGLQIIGAIAIFIIGRFIAGMIRKLVQKVMAKSHVDLTLIAFISNVVYVILLILITISAISNIGVNTNSLAAMIGAAGLAIGLAFQNSLSNVAAGIILILIRPFRVGHDISTNGSDGTVEVIDIMTTTIRTYDNKRVIMPNNMILTAKIVNNNINETRRADIAFGIGYGDDVAQAKQLISDIIMADARILKDPAPFVGVTELAETRVNMAVRVWSKTSDLGNVQNDLFEKITTTLNANGFTMQAPGFSKKTA